MAGSAAAARSRRERWKAARSAPVGRATRAISFCIVAPRALPAAAANVAGRRPASVYDREARPNREYIVDFKENGQGYCQSQRKPLYPLGVTNGRPLAPPREGTHEAFTVLRAYHR